MIVRTGKGGSMGQLRLRQTGSLLGPLEIELCDGDTVLGKLSPDGGSRVIRSGRAQCWRLSSTGFRRLRMTITDVVSGAEVGTWFEATGRLVLHDGRVLRLVGDFWGRRFDWVDPASAKVVSIVHDGGPAGLIAYRAAVSANLDLVGDELPLLALLGALCDTLRSRHPSLA